MGLLINSARYGFLVASKKSVALFLFVVAISTTFYKAFRFNIDIDLKFVLGVLSSILFAAMFYFMAYGFGKFTSVIAKNMYKKSVDNFLFAPLLLLFALNFLMYWQAIFSTSWQAYENIFNPSLILLAAFLGLGTCCFTGRIFPPSELLRKEYFMLLEQNKALKLIATLSTIVVILLLLSYVQNTNSNM